MEPAQGPDNIVAGTQVQVVGIAQLDLTFDAFQIVGAESTLNGTLGAYVHKYRGLYNAAVGAGKAAAPGAALGFDDFKHPLLLSRILRIAVPGCLFIIFSRFLRGRIFLQHSIKIAGITLVLFIQPSGNPWRKPQGAAADYQKQHQKDKRCGSLPYITFQQ